jgi:pyruvate dehydrogenase E1 component beta subunit
MAEIMRFSSAVSQTVIEEMERDPTIFYLARSGPNKARVEKFGWERERYRYSGINETQGIGAGIGAALAGLRPIVDYGYGDFIMDGWGQIVLQAAKQRFKVAYSLPCAVVIDTNFGGKDCPTVHHSGCYHNWVANAPGLFVGVPTTPADAVGLWRTSLRDVVDPVVMMTDRGVRGVQGPVPENDYTIPFGVADVKREGSDVTIAAVGLWVHEALEVADTLAGRGIDVEVWDPRSLIPFDRQSLIDSVSKTGALVVVDQAPKSFGTTGEFMATVAEAVTPVPPMARVATKDVPVGASPPLRYWMYPSQEKIISAVEDVLERK